MKRRQLLATLGGFGTLAVAGCTSDGGGGGDTTGGEATTGGETTGDGGGETTTDGGGGSPTATRTPTETSSAELGATVKLKGFAFEPVRASIDPGQAVKWVNEDSTGHDVTAAQFTDGAASWDFSKSLSGGASVTHTFEQAGVYEYYCTIHGESSMCGAVLVGDASLSGSLPCESPDSTTTGGGDGGDDGYY